jgi:lipopolysaccharide export system permease protein
LQQIKNNKVVYNLRADNMNWDTAKKMWKLTNSIERFVDPMAERVNYVQERFKQFNFMPADLKRDEFLRNRLTSPELNRVIALEKMRGSETVKELMMEDAHRTATPVAVLILTLIGAILAARKIRGGSGLHLAYGILICAVFILTDRFSTIFSTKGNLNPYLAAWIPNIVFCFITIGLYKKAPK